MAEIELGTLYEMNKEMMKKEPPLDPIQYAKKINESVGRYHCSV